MRQCNPAGYRVWFTPPPHSKDKRFSKSLVVVARARDVVS